MRKTILSLLAIWMLVCAELMGIFLFTTEKEMEVSADTIIVDDDGTPGVDCNYTTIAEGISAASHGDIVYVKNGTYYEDITVNKRINLSGENKTDTIIDGSSTAIKVTSPWVNITGFTIANQPIGIDIKSPNNRVSDCNFINNSWYGVILYSHEGNMIDNNTFIDNVYAFLTWNIAERYNRIENNTINGSSTYGIRLYQSDDVLVYNNILYDNKEGISLYNSDNNVIDNNTVQNSTTYGIFLEGNFGSHNNHLIGNTITNGSYGIYLLRSTNNTLEGNLITQSRDDAVRFETSSNNWILKNTIKDNDANGIRICYGSNDNTVQDNNDMINNSCGIFLGIYISDLIVNTTIRNNNNFTHNRGDGIFIYHCTDNIITGNNFSHNGNYGIHLYADSNHNIISNNEFFNNKEGGIYLRYSSNGNRIIDNTITLGNYGIDLNHEVGGDPCINNVLLDNTLIGTNNSICLGLANNNHIYNNTIKNPDLYGLFVNRTRESNYANFIPRNNTCDGDTIYYFYDEHDLKFEGIESLDQHNVTNLGKFTFYTCGNITISNKTISNGTIGIFIHSSDNITLDNNTITNMAEVGLHVENGYWHYITQKSKVDGEPIYYYTNVTDITIENLNLDTWNVSNVGKITLAYCEDILLRNNTVSNNDYGIFLWSCKNITMWDNNMTSPKVAGLFIEEGFYHYISQNNTANDQEILYFTDIHGTESAPIFFNTYHLTAKFNNLNHTNVGLISFVNCSYLIIENNTLNYNYGSGLFVASSFNITIRNNTANYNCNGVWLESSFNTTATLNYFNINKQVVGIHTGAGYGRWAGIHIRNCQSLEWNRNVITNNTEVTSNKRGVYVESSKNNVISFHNQTINNNERAIYLDYSSPYIHGNSFYGGIVIDGEYSNPIIENNIFESGSIAIYHLRNSSRSAKIINNTFDDFHLAALYLQHNSSPEIGHNLITNVWADGITAYHEDSSPYIHNNTISHTGLMGIQLEDSNATIENNTIFDVNQGINVNLNPHVPASEYIYYGSNATIKDNVIYNCSPKPLKSYRGIGIYFAGYSTGLAVNNTINETTHSGIRLDVGTTPWEIGSNRIWGTATGINILGPHPNLKVHGNTIFDSNDGIGVQGNTHRSMVIDFNNVTDNERGIFSWASDCSITNNLVISNDYGIDVRGGSSPIIDLNIMESNLYGIRCLESSSPTVQNNHINWSTEYGIYADSSSPRIESNIFLNRVDRTDGFATYLNSCSNLTEVLSNEYINSYRAINLMDTPSLVKGNNITLVEGNASRDDTIGIAVNGHSYEIIKDNIINDGDCGIKVGNNSNATIVGNLIHNSSYFGILLINSENVTIYNNGIYSGSSYGIYLNNSNYTLIYHNNIINNTIQAYDDQNTNSWDDGYPSGGNYWSDYDGVDYNSTPSQDVPPPDGLGDTPYTDILGWPGVQDDYPLMHPHVYRMQLYYGWNLISIPNIQSDIRLDTILSSIEGAYNKVWMYNITDTADHWKHNGTLKTPYLNDLDNIDHLIGFWIYITEIEGVLFEYPGTRPTSNQTIPLHPGWNMVGYPSQTGYNRTQGLNNLIFGTHVDSIWTFDAANQKWEELGELNNFKPGKGYWINAKVECTWEAPL